MNENGDLSTIASFMRSRRTQTTGEDPNYTQDLSLAPGQAYSIAVSSNDTTCGFYRPNEMNEKESTFPFKPRRKEKTHAKRLSREPHSFIRDTHK